jgi:ferredoxin-NADP reductase
MLHVQVPDVNERAVYMCGPIGFMEDMERALRTINGGLRARVFKESFDYWLLSPRKHVAQTLAKPWSWDLETHVRHEHVRETCNSELKRQKKHTYDRFHSFREKRETWR